MSIIKNGLEVKLNYDFSLNEENLSKFEYSKSPEIGKDEKNIFEIIENDNTNTNTTQKEIKSNNEEEKKEKDIKKDSSTKNQDSQLRQFLNLESFNENNIFIIGKKPEIKLDIEYKINNIEIDGKEQKKDNMNDENKVKSNQVEKEKKYNFESHIIAFKIIGRKSSLKIKSKLVIQNNINNFKIINNKNKEKKRNKNMFPVHIINLEIKKNQIKKRNPEILFKKVDNFNIKEKLHSKNINQNNSEPKNYEIKKNRKDINQKLDIYKTETSNNIQLNKIVTNLNNPKPNNIIGNSNNNNKDFINKNEYLYSYNNNDILSNKEPFKIPFISNDIINLENQYEKIKKDLNELYPIFCRNKVFRENFFIHLSQGNRGKYNFYLSLYKIIKDEKEEKNNINFENYLKMKKIINGNRVQSKNKTKLKPLKKNFSSCCILDRNKNKMISLYTEGNNYY